MRFRLSCSSSAVALIVLAGITAPAASNAPSLSGAVLRAADGSLVEVSPFVRRNKLTAIVFFSVSCPCFAAHRGRLAALVREMKARDVGFMLVDSERHASGEVIPVALPEAALPVLRDEGGRLARQLGAQYATETFVFDSAGALRHRGGIDDERKYLSETPKSHLRDALVSLLEHRAPPLASAKTLGCTLRLR